VLIYLHTQHSIIAKCADHMGAIISSPVIPAVCSNKKAYVWLSWTGEDQTLISAIILAGGCHAKLAMLSHC
jgi:hypothetical protein